MSGVLRKEDDQGEAEVGERAGQGLGDNCQLSTVSGDDCQCGQLSVGTTVSGPTVSRPWTTVRGNCQSYEKTVRSYSCPLPAALGMGIEINNGYSCNLTAVRRRRGQFFSPIGSGPRGSGLWNGDRDKHWEQLLFISGSSSPGAVFFSYWIWARGQRLVEWG